MEQQVAQTNKGKGKGSIGWQTGRRPSTSKSSIPRRRRVGFAAGSALQEGRAGRRRELRRLRRRRRSSVPELHLRHPYLPRHGRQETTRPRALTTARRAPSSPTASAKTRRSGRRPYRRAPQVTAASRRRSSRSHPVSRMAPRSTTCTCGSASRRAMSRSRLRSWSRSVRSAWR